MPNEEHTLSLQVYLYIRTPIIYTKLHTYINPFHLAVQSLRFYSKWTVDIFNKLCWHRSQQSVNMDIFFFNYSNFILPQGNMIVEESLQKNLARSNLHNSLMQFIIKTNTPHVHYITPSPLVRCTASPKLFGSLLQSSRSL